MALWLNISALETRWRTLLSAAGGLRLRRTLGVIVGLGAAFVCAISLGFASVFDYLNHRIQSPDTYIDSRYETPLRLSPSDGAQLGE